MSLNDNVANRPRPYGGRIIVGVTSRHRDVPFTTAFGQIPGVEHVREDLYPQATGLLGKHFPMAAAFSKSLGLARVRNRSQLLHSRQKILLNRVPWVVSSDALIPFWPRPYLSKKLYLKVAGLLASEECRAILPYSMAAKKLLEIRNAEHGRLDSILQRCRVICPAVEDCPQAYESNILRDVSKNIHIVFVGTQFFIKGGHLVVNVFERLRRQYPIRMTIVSEMSTADWTTWRPPEMSNQYRDRIKNLEITHYEYLDNQAVRKLMGTADIVAMPSIDETFGIVFLEALASGVVPVGSSVRAIPEIIVDGVTGICVPHEVTEEGLMLRYPGFEHDLEREVGLKLEQLIDNPMQLREMKIAARKDYLNRFTMTRLAGELGEVYARAVQ